jgi:3-oxoacyl-[acyl-carrier-protein] synthase-1
MSSVPVAMHGVGLVTAVGLSAAESCAALRAKITNPTETRFIDSNGAWIMAHQVQLAQPWRGLTKLAKMAAMAIDEALEGVPRNEWRSLPLLLCVAERARPGRLDGLDDRLFQLVVDELDATFADESAVIAMGRVSGAVAFTKARELISRRKAGRVLIAAADSLLTWPTLSHYEREGRLLTARNSNGFMPGEGAGALLVGPPHGEVGELLCTGVGFGHEHAHVLSEEPLRADGLSQAVKAALADAAERQPDTHFRVCDLSGEQYYFKEASLTMSRVRPYRGDVPELWHPAESTGETGAVSALVCLAVSASAARKAYAPGARALLHFANDAGERAALRASIG